MKMICKTSLSAIALIFFLTACNSNQQANPVVETQIKAASTAETKAGTSTTESTPGSPAVNEASIATIKAPVYEAIVHKAISFVPKNDGVGLMKVKEGNHFVVVDMSVRNTSKTREIDFGQILLSTKVSDEKGKEYRFNAMAVAAYTLDNPDPKHQAQYNAMWNKLKPGDSYRTIVFGFEVPLGQKNFVLSMREDDDILKDGKRNVAKFSTE